MTMEKMRAEKSDKYKELKKSKGKKEYEWYFLRYIPHEANEYKNNKKNKKKTQQKKKTQKKKKSNNKTKKSKKKKKMTLISLFK